MKRIFWLIALALSIASCRKVEGEGNIVTRSFPIDSESVTGLQLDDGFRVTVVSDQSSGMENVVKITTYENLFEYIDFDIKSGIVGLEFQEVETKNDLHLYATIALGNIASYEATSSSQIIIDSSSATDQSEFYSSDITVRLSGGSSFKGFDMTATSDISAYLSGGSTMQISTFGIPKLTTGSTLSGGSTLQYDGTNIDYEGATLSGGSTVESVE